MADTISNFVLERVLYENYKELGVPSYTDEENDFADALSKTYMGNDHIPGVAADNDENAREQVVEMQRACGHAMNAFLAPLYQGNAFKAGSTDVGDVSWLTPTAQIHVAAWPNGCRDIAGRMFPVTVQKSATRQRFMRERCWRQQLLTCSTSRKY